jgi:hypothetical protein
MKSEGDLSKLFIHIITIFLGYHDTCKSVFLRIQLIHFAQNNLNSIDYSNHTFHMIIIKKLLFKH